MLMSRELAQQVATLINNQNQLTVEYTAEQILEHADRYILRLDRGVLVGVVEVKLVQWYQAEIDHVSVGPRHQGIGTWLVESAERKAKDLGARIAQCTIRVGNIESEGLFTKMKYLATVTFMNVRSENAVAVYQKVLVPVTPGHE